MTRRLVIMGASGHGREALDVVEALHGAGADHEFLGFLDDGTVDAALLVQRGVHHLGGTDLLASLVPVQFLVGIASPTARRRLDALGAASGAEAAAVVHPQATIGSVVRVAPGAIVAAGARVTTNVRFGRHVHVGVNATIGHDTTLGDYATVLPGAAISGNVTLEDDVTVGTGAAIKQGVRIGRGTVIGAGAVVIRNLPPGVTAVGVPARVLER